MKVGGKFLAIFVYCLRGGGAERVAAYLANGLTERGDRVVVVTELGPETDQYQLAPGIERVVIGQGEQQNPFNKVLGLIKKVMRVRAFLRTRRPDAFISFMTRCNNIALLANLGLSFRVIISERNDPRFRAELLIDRMIRRLLYRRASLVVAQTSTIEAIVKDRFKVRRTACIPNPCVVNPTLPATAPVNPSGRGYILAMGRLFPQKGFDILIKAFAASAASLDHDLVIAGQGGTRELARVGRDIGDGRPGDLSRPCRRSIVPLIPLQAVRAVFPV